MAHENPKTKRAKTMDFGKQAFIARTYGGKPSETAKRNFNRPSYQMRKGGVCTTE